MNPPYMFLSHSNTELEQRGVLPVNHSIEWIWGTDPTEPLNAGALLNRSHLLGLLACRHRSILATPPNSQYITGLQIMDTHPEKMNLRQLKDTLDNLCVQLPKMLESPNPPTSSAVTLVDACFSRFGFFLAEGGGVDLMNDTVCVEAADPLQPELFKINRMCMRRTLNSFLLLYRHLHLATIARQIPPIHRECSLHKHHLEASNDDFDMLCMRTCLPVAAVINYKNDFSCFFNHISQVVYFHYPTYERIKRVPITELQKATPVQLLPALRLLHPAIQILYEEDKFDITKPLGYWAWLVLPGRIYLAGPKCDVYYSRDLTSLLGVYLQTL